MLIRATVDSRQPQSAGRRARWFLAAALVSCGAAEADRQAQKPLPPFSSVRDVVRRQFVSITYYEPGDIISESQVEPVFDHLQRMGWRVADRRAILAQMPGDRDFIVKLLRSDQGREFMGRIRQYPMAYDRLDRLAKTPGGRRAVAELMRAKDGFKMNEYMTTSKGGKNLGKFLAKAPKGGKFNTPTGRIYTVDMFLARLQKSYATEQQQRRHQEQLTSTGAPPP